MDNSKLEAAIREATKTIVSNEIDRQLRTRQLIPVSILREYWLGSESERKVLIEQYGPDAFEFSKTDELWFIMFLIKEAKELDRTSYPINFQGKSFTARVSIEENVKPKSEPVDESNKEVKSVIQNLKKFLFNRFNL